jgi:transposase
MPQEQSAGKPKTRRYSEQEKAAAVQMVRTLRPRRANVDVVLGAP